MGEEEGVQGRDSEGRERVRVYLKESQREVTLTKVSDSIKFKN